MIDLTGYLIVGASAAVATAGATKGVEILAHKKGWLAEPDERRLHPVPTPNVGGLAFLVGLIAALLLASRMDRFSSVISGNSELIGVLIAAVANHGAWFRRRHSRVVTTHESDWRRCRRHRVGLVWRHHVLFSASVPRRICVVERLDSTVHRCVVTWYDTGDQLDRRPRWFGNRHRGNCSWFIFCLQQTPRRLRPCSPSQTSAH